jgi:ubiquinone/menaquinone biosynthesis C-methylase UbiE
MAANPALALQRYAELAEQYDASCRRMESVRARTIAALKLRRGDVVIDVCSGTGLSFAQIEARIGVSGRIIAIEQSPHMMRAARKRAAAGGFSNITFIEASVQDARIPALADAILFNYTHDVLQSHAALAHVFNHVQPGARVAVSGTKFFPWWLAPLNLFVALRSWRYLTTFEGIAKPYEHLLDYVIGWEMEATFGGMGYIGHGVHPGVVPKLFAERRFTLPQPA